MTNEEKRIKELELLVEKLYAEIGKLYISYKENVEDSEENHYERFRSIKKN